MATITPVYPSSLSALIEATSLPVTNSAPYALQSATSFSMSSLLIRKSGITFLTTPPRFSDFSNTVTGTPALERYIAQESPAGPPPITATFLSILASGFAIFLRTVS
mgnify:CR=1 FL=1